MFVKFFRFLKNYTFFILLKKKKYEKKSERFESLSTFSSIV